MYYATLAQVRNEIDMQNSGTGEASEAINDALVLEALRVVTGRMLKIIGYDFLPLKDTRYFDALGHHIDDFSGTMELKNSKGRYPLLLPTTVVNGQGVTLALNTDYRPVPRSATPAFYLHLLSAASKSWSDYSTDWVEVISVEGVWGYHTDYAHAWLNSGDTVRNNQLSANGTSLTVLDADGADALNRTPRFSPGQLLQIESEWLEVIATDTEANTLTVTRGARGTIAAIHAQTTPISIFQVEDAINRSAWRWAAYLYARRGAFETSRFDGVATVEFPADMPGEVRDTMDSYADKSWSTP